MDERGIHRAFRSVTLSALHASSAPAAWRKERPGGRSSLASGFFRMRQSAFGPSIEFSRRRPVTASTPISLVSPFVFTSKE